MGNRKSLTANYFILRSRLQNIALKTRSRLRKIKRSIKPLRLKRQLMAKFGKCHQLRDRVAQVAHNNEVQTLQWSVATNMCGEFAQLV